jgi:hypothetical protein
MAGTFTVATKELRDQFGSKRFLILFAVVLLLSTLTAYQGVDYIRNNEEAGFVHIFSGSQFGFSFIQIMVFFGPLLGLALGFDAINKERANGTLDPPGAAHLQRLGDQRQIPRGSCSFVDPYGGHHRHTLRLGDSHARVRADWSGGLEDTDPDAADDSIPSLLVDLGHPLLGVD